MSINAFLKADPNPDPRSKLMTMPDPDPKEIISDPHCAVHIFPVIRKPSCELAVIRTLLLRPTWCDSNHVQLLLLLVMTTLVMMIVFVIK